MHTALKIQMWQTRNSNTFIKIKSTTHQTCLHLKLKHMQNACQKLKFKLMIVQICICISPSALYTSNIPSLLPIQRHFQGTLRYDNVACMALTNDVYED